MNHMVEFIRDYAKNCMLDGIKKDLEETMMPEDYAEFLNSDLFAHMKQNLDDVIAGVETDSLKYE